MSRTTLERHLVVRVRKKGIDIAESTLYSSLYYGTFARKLQPLFYSFYAVFWNCDLHVTARFSQLGQLNVIYPSQFTNSRFFHNISRSFHTAKSSQKNFAASPSSPQKLPFCRCFGELCAHFFSFFSVPITLCIRDPYTSRRAGCRPPRTARPGRHTPADGRIPRRSPARAGISRETRAPQGVSR